MDDELRVFQKQAKRAALGAAIAGAAAFGGVGLWVAGAPLETAVRASGRIEAQAHRRIVRHPQGGLIAALHVAEGEAVAAGAPLIAVDSSDLEKEKRALQTRLAGLRAREARGRAHSLGAQRYTPPIVPDAERAADFWRRAIAAEAALFAAERAEDAATLAKLRAQIRHADEKYEALKAEAKAAAWEAAAIDRRLEALRTLAKTGAASRSKRDLVEAEGARVAARRAGLDGAIADAKRMLAELRGQADHLPVSRRLSAETVRAQAAVEAAELEARIHAVAVRIDHTVLFAPVSGRVVDLNPHGAGESLRPGEDIMTIAPDDGGRLARVNVAPKDAARVKIGARAAVRPIGVAGGGKPIEATVARLSADAIEKDGERFFVAEIAYAQEGPPLGAPVEALMFGRKTTVLEVISGPLRARLARAMREE